VVDSYGLNILALLKYDRTARPVPFKGKFQMTEPVGHFNPAAASEPKVAEEANAVVSCTKMNLLFPGGVKGLRNRRRIGG
jgi:hypothetical protein